MLQGTYAGNILFLSLALISRHCLTSKNTGDGIEETIANSVSSVLL